MSDWTSGYVADIGYTYGYYPELNPLRIKLAFINAGLHLPEIGTACELGFGQGISVNLHAAASLTQWSGTDFNPSQAAFAQELTNISQSGAKLYDEAFADFAHRPDLPDFDYIGLHGIWSWINDENRAVIVDFIKRKLKVGGVLYISYNTQPGWAAMVPMRDLLNEHSEVMGRNGAGIVARLDEALDFADELVALQPGYMAANPQVAERLKTIRGQNRNYLVHEYFNRDWLPMSFANMAKRLDSAKLSYACSANYSDHIDIINLTTDQQQFLKNISDPLFRQTVRDFIVNQQFRKDYWVKGPRHLTGLDKLEAARQLRILLITPRTHVTLTITGNLGEATLLEALYGPVLEALANHQVLSVAELETILNPHGITHAQLFEVILTLAAKGVIMLAQDENNVAKNKDKCHRLNTALMHKARSSQDIGYLTSPVVGGIAVERFHQLMLLGIKNKKKTVDELADFMLHILFNQGQKIIKEGKILESVEENLDEFKKHANTFLKDFLPIYEALQLV